MNRPRLFLSAVSEELRTARQAVAATVALRTWVSLASAGAFATMRPKTMAAILTYMTDPPLTAKRNRAARKRQLRQRVQKPPRACCGRASRSSLC